MAVTEPIFTKRILAQQSFEKNS